MLGRPRRAAGDVVPAGYRCHHVKCSTSLRRLWCGGMSVATASGIPDVSNGDLPAFGDGLVDWEVC